MLIFINTTVSQKQRVDTDRNEEPDSGVKTIRLRVK
jgi:hypothetical protein